MVAGSGGFAALGLALRMPEAGFRLETPRRFAAPVPPAMTAAVINLVLDRHGVA
jgi:hypothetical protein